MSKRYNQTQVCDYWTNQALKHKQSPEASWSDQMVIEMEIREILKRLADGDRVLDVGCANGYSTINFASQRQINIRGLDFIPEMIDQARLRLNRLAKDLSARVEFDVGDIRTLSEQTEIYDKVIVIRVIINLTERSDQKKALAECARVLKPGGMLLLSEATLQGWEQMNRFRREWQLPDIPMPPFNSYLDQKEVIEELSSELQLIEIVNFASTYYVGTRVLKPLLIKALGLEINVADPDMEWNRWFSRLPSWGDYGTQKLFVFRKMRLSAG